MTAHTDHPLRHFDRTCPGCVAEEEAREGRSARMDRAIYHRLLTDLCSLILGSSVPIGPMRSRKDYPPELAKAIAFLHDIRERQSASPTFTPPEGERNLVIEECAAYLESFYIPAPGAAALIRQLKRSKPQPNALKAKATIFNTPSPNIVQGDRNE